MRSFRTNYLAAIHRIDVDSRTGNLEYGIPADNPFLSDPTTVPEMYAYGLRQPYQGSMDMGDPTTGYSHLVTHKTQMVMGIHFSH